MYENADFRRSGKSTVKPESAANHDPIPTAHRHTLENLRCLRCESIDFFDPQDEAHTGPIFYRLGIEPEDDS
jgi:hypothetical protein